MGQGQQSKTKDHASPERAERFIVQHAVAQTGPRRARVDGIKQDGRALEYASERLKDDREFVLAAVTQNGWALRHAAVTQAPCRGGMDKSFISTASR